MEKGKCGVYKSLEKYKKCQKNNCWTEQVSAAKVEQESNDYEILEV
jgi:hypothetical protein